MVNLSYRFPGDIPVHFLGETQIPIGECIKKKKRYQLICFMLFYMIVNVEKKAGKFTVTETCKYDRLKIWLSKNGRKVFEAIEDCFSEWVIRMTGTADDILDFSVECMFNFLHKPEVSCKENDSHTNQ